MSDLNSCSFIGRLGGSPEQVQVGDTSVTKFSIAVGESWKDKEGNKQERTEWINVEAWGKLADICAEYLQKGKQVYISGKMKTDTYEKDGITKYSTKIVCKDMQMLGSKGDSVSDAPVVDAPSDDFDDIEF